MLGALLLFDLALVARRPHVPSMRESALWVTFYVALALGFSVVLLVVAGGAKAGEFLAGWATEYSLSVDNLFVFVIIMSRFAVPRGNQQKVLLVGIILSLVLRGGCILLGRRPSRPSAGSSTSSGRSWCTRPSSCCARTAATRRRYHENAVVRRARRVLPISRPLRRRQADDAGAGRRMLTPMIIVLLAIGSTDVLFALDSIPAIFGLTQDPFIVFTATLFALMGLRQLYFLLGRPARPARLPAAGPVGDPRVHRRQAHPRGARTPTR